MKIIPWLMVFLLILGGGVTAFVLNAVAQHIERSHVDAVYDRRDSIKILNKCVQFAGSHSLPVGEIIATICQSYLHTPYVAHTLENGAEERLIINLRELDCMTYVENCLALARTIKAEHTSFATFADNLEKIRYRHGLRNGYTSRLHYFSEWIADNCQKGIVETLPFEVPLTVNVNFMSTHPDSYEVLKANPALVPEIAAREKAINAMPHVYIPKDKIADCESQLQSGDIIGITTSVSGLDVVHDGILLRLDDGRIHVIHASSSLGEVVISTEPLPAFIMQRKSYTGIMVVRAK
ncbi:MAG: DUF1460 domain-containing protein [Bacteroidales bacterium]|nr:DUF1460 domain-containing protein [Bacteroidales bacterium]